MIILITLIEFFCLTLLSTAKIPVTLEGSEIKTCREPGRLQIIRTSIDSCDDYDKGSNICSLGTNNKARLTTIFQRGDVKQSVIESSKVIATAYVGGEPFERKEPEESYKTTCERDICTLVNDFVIEEIYPKTEVDIDYSLTRRGTGEKLICFNQRVQII